MGAPKGRVFSNRVSLRIVGKQETGLEEINGDLLQADLWPGITSVRPSLDRNSINCPRPQEPPPRLETDFVDRGLGCYRQPEVA